MLSKRILTLMFVLLFLPLVGCLPGLTPSTPEEISTGTITGVVNGSPGVPLVGATISIGGTGLSTITDSSGAYRLSDVPLGSYHLIVTYQGKQIKKKIIFTAGVTITLNISFSQEQQEEEEERQIAIKGRITVPAGTPIASTRTIYFVSLLDQLFSSYIYADGIAGIALPNATVNIIDPVSGDIIGTTTTDNDGNYEVSDIPAGGPYIIEAIKGNIHVLDIVEKVEVGKTTDAGVADATSTALALVFQARVVAGENPSAINLDAILSDPAFLNIVKAVENALLAGEDVTTSTTVAVAITPPAPPPVTPLVTPPVSVIELYSVGDSSAEWTTEKAHTGLYSVKLTMPAGTGWVNDNAEVRIAILGDLKVSDISSFSYWIIAPDSYTVPIEFYLDTDDDGEPDKIIAGQKWGVASPDDWLEINQDSLSCYMAWKNGYEWLPTWGHVQTKYGSAKVLRVDIGYGSLGSNNALTAYVDDLTIDGTTYELEPN